MAKLTTNPLAALAPFTPSDNPAAVSTVTPTADQSPRNRLLTVLRRGLVIASVVCAFGVAGAVLARVVEGNRGAEVVRANVLEPTKVSLLDPAPAAPDIASDNLPDSVARELLHETDERDHSAAEPAAEPASAQTGPALPLEPQSAARQIAGRVVFFEVTAYCACTRCCGPNAVGLTASGKHVSYNDGRFVAADTSVLPFGTKLVVPGYAETPVEVIDRGGAIKGNRLDVFYPSHDEALQWGRRWVAVTVLGD